MSLKEGKGDPMVRAESVKTVSGRNAKYDGHIFEQSVCDYLNHEHDKQYVVDGKSGTKIDIHSVDMTERISIKKVPTNTQVGLITQDRFIEAMGIDDPNLILFIRQFFGGDDYSHYPRHRMTKNDIDSRLNEKFVSFLNQNRRRIFEIAITEGSQRQTNNVNLIMFPLKRHDVNTLVKINLEKMLNCFDEDGFWVQNNTTFHFEYSGSKLFALQMFGAGEKYTNGYHGLQFRINCGKIYSTNRFNENCK